MSIEKSQVSEYVNTPVSIDGTGDESLGAKDYVKDTFTNRSALNYDRQQHIAQLISGYASGMKATVVYFKQHMPVDTRTGDSDGSISEIHSSLLQINDFELTFQEGLAFSELTETNINEITGNAYVYPGFYPSPGDLFLYEINPGQLGLFKVNDSKKLSMRKGTYHAIEFILAGIPSNIEVKEIADTVVDVVYFSKQKFLAGESALLTSETHVLLKDISIVRNVLTSHYKQKFWNEHMYGSFVREDGIYDPYMIDFLNKVFSYMDLGVMPRKLMTKVVNRNDTLLYALLNPHNIARSAIKKFVAVRTHTLDQRATDINTLLNKQYCEVVSDEVAETEGSLPLYILGQTFYNNDPDKFLMIDKLVANYISERLIYQNDLMTLAKQYRTLSVDQQFYQIPIYILLLDALSRALTQ